MPSAALHVGPIDGSALALEQLHLDQGGERIVEDAARDSLLYVASGSGTLALDGTEHRRCRLGARHSCSPASARRSRRPRGSSRSSATVGARTPTGTHRWAAVESRRRSTTEKPSRRPGARSFQLLFGPHNGSTRATLFAGFIPPGKAPWHYHLYDEIVWVPEGPGRLHLGDDTEELGPGSAFRLRPRQVHIVENASADRELTIIGVFTPAGSPSAAYLTPDVAAEYRFAG